MIKKLVKHGNSSALVIDKPILDILNINEKTELEVTTDGLTLTIRPIVKGKKSVKKISADKEIQKSFEKIVSKYDVALRKLAKN
ncbi:MAG: AbrB/MazE/SpoVT family DNA-binding domain-containing protein [bacterium]